MNTPSGRLSLEDQIAQWRGYLRRRRVIDGPDIEELESHLREQVAALTQIGLTADEAFLISVKRMGSLDELSREFAREHSERLWKQLVMSQGGSVESDASSRKEAFVAIGLAIAAGAAVKVPALFGVPMDTNGENPFYIRNASLFVFPQLITFLVWKRGVNLATALWFFLPCLIGAVFANAYPLGPESDTFALSALHLPIALWLAVGLAYTGGRWLAGSGRMDFVRFSGELAIYYVLMAIGGGVLIGFTVMMFDAIRINAQSLAFAWLLPCGAAGAILIGSWLVEAKQSVIENMAPVLTRVFTPLFTLVLLVFLGTMVWTGNPIDVQRDVLISFDLLLVVVVGLVLYAVSARDPQAPPGLFDRLQFLLVVCALLVDALALAAIATRISEFGFTPNRTAALGENIILLVNLAWSAWLYARFVRRRGAFAALEQWQVAYLPVYSLWAATVVIAFPPLFAYI
jgi:hypothetical protein